MADAPLIGPLLPIPREVNREELKAAALLIGVIAAARFAPSTAGPIARYGFGISARGPGLTVEAGPLALTNLLPQPFGLVPAPNYGLKPNYYLPRDVGLTLPNLIPGVKYHKAEFELRVQAYRDATARAAESARVGALVQNYSTERLQLLAAQIAAGTGPQFADPQAAIAAINAAIASNEAARIASNLRLGFDADGNPLSAGSNGGTPIAPPNGFVQVPPLGPVVPVPAPGQNPLVPVAPDGTTTGPPLPNSFQGPKSGWYTRPAPAGPTVDQLIILMVNDP